MTSYRRRVIPLLIGLAGCGSEPGPEIDPYDSTLLGLYTIEAWTVNEASCDGEGPSVLAARSEHAALVQACTESTPRLHVRPCVDEAECESRVCGGGFFEAFAAGWPQLHGNDHDGWHAGAWLAPEMVGDHCEASLRSIKLEVDGDGIVITNRVHHTGDYGPPKAEYGGMCWPDDDASAAINKSECSSLEVVRLRRTRADCDPLVADACGPSELCAPYGNRFMCAPAEPPPAGPGEACGVQSCAPGLACVNAQVLTDCDTARCCSAFCDHSLPDRDVACAAQAAGLLCTDWYLEGYSQPDREAVGVCSRIHRCDDDFELPWPYVCDGFADCDDETDEANC
ncbi:hypothetical protein [Nannocystis sp.]|uniref:hypothetical protein n=1 Tax=Nannocystis sp. TaxID=1962667 RepID=UPI0024217AAA|nr:hypothetical protein [Nannocystis sp.]MBK7827975.1 hypothetical protein [Nannocystis sp.]MBK9752499.1 hypothetical protein [Nannocystis sp.]